MYRIENWRKIVAQAVTPAPDKRQTLGPLATIPPLLEKVLGISEAMRSASQGLGGAAYMLLREHTGRRRRDEKSDQGPYAAHRWDQCVKGSNVLNATSQLCNSTYCQNDFNF